MTAPKTKRLYYGDNLHVLRDHIKDESVDLIYLDPPFNSKRDYNLLFKTPKGMESDAQITAFEDSWHWGQQAEDEFKEILKSGNTDVAELMQALRAFLKENDMMAYLTMMANRLLELHRVLKDTGSLYLHCDPTASHYLKIVLDAVFGKECFKNEITWKRHSAHNNATRNFAIITDSIFYYAKGSEPFFRTVYSKYSEDYVEKFFTKLDEKGRRYRTNSLKNPSDRPNLKYEYKGYPPPDTGWTCNIERMQEYDRQGRLEFPKSPTGRLSLRYYLEEMEGMPATNLWDDVASLGGNHEEKLGYPTQKPLALLERIISASSHEGDVVLDPFCGCGTALDAAEKLKRQWIGIDVTHLSISLIEKRLTERHPNLKNETKLSRAEVVQVKSENLFEVIGTPQDFDAAKDLAERDKHQFELWGCTLVQAQPFKSGKKGADGGVDGVRYIEVNKDKTEKVIVSVKGGANVGLTMLKDLITTVTHNKAVAGLFVTLTRPTKPMISEAAAAGHYDSPLHGSFPKIQILTVEGLLNGNERPQLPDLSRGAQTFKKAKAEKKNKKSDQTGLFE